MARIWRRSVTVRRQHPGRGAVLGEERVAVVERVIATDGRGDHAHLDLRFAGEERGWIKHDAQRVRCLDDLGPRPVEAGLELGRGPAVEGEHAVHEDAGRGAVHAVRRVGNRNAASRGRGRS